MKKLADFIIEKRLLVLTIISLISLFFVYKVKDIEVYTKFADLLPPGHEYIFLRGMNTLKCITRLEPNLVVPTQ